MRGPTHDSLREAREALAENAIRLENFKTEALQAPGFDVEGAKIALRRASELRAELTRLVSDCCETFRDGRRLLRSQVAALETFAHLNNIPIETVLHKSTIQGNVVVSCHFVALGLRTLEGLEGLWSLKHLAVYNYYSAFTPNYLTSLKGVPVESIEEIIAENCGLQGDLSAITPATKLRMLDIRRNSRLVSLKGIPTQSLEDVFGYSCGFAGNLSDIRHATKLKRLDVRFNGEISSLEGTPLQSIEQVWASRCGLKGDHNFLSAAPRLRWLDLSHNPDLDPLDVTTFNSKIHIEL